MATYTHKRCPHCGALYETYSTYTKHFSNHSGSPFLTCKSCSKTFVDKDVKEPALKPYSDSGFSVLNCFFAAFMPFGIAGIILTGCAIAPETRSIGVAIFAILVDTLYLFITGNLIKNRKKLQIQDKIEYEKSYERLKDIDYAIALKKAGFDVPSHFLKGFENITSGDTVDDLIEEDDIDEEPVISTNNTDDNTQSDVVLTVESNQEKYRNYDIEFVELLREWYDSWKKKTTNENHYDFLKYIEMLDSCFKKDGKSALDFCFELYKKGVVFNSEITDHTFKQLHDVLNCDDKNEIDWLKQKVVNGIDGFYIVWVLEHP